MRLHGTTKFSAAVLLDFFPKLSGKYVTDVKADQSPLFVHSTLILKK